MATSHNGRNQTNVADNTTNFFRQLAQKKNEMPPEQPPMSKKARLLWGIGLGAAVGISSGVLVLVLYWTVASYSAIAIYPLGPMGNALLGVIFGVIIGGLCAMPESALNGVILGCAATATALVLRNHLNPTPIFPASLAQGLDPTYLAVSDIVFSLLQVGFIAILCLPFELLLRRGIEDQGELAYLPLWSWKRLRFPLAVVGLVGAFTTAFVFFPAYF